MKNLEIDQLRDMFELSEFFEKGCDDCKWNNEAFEEEYNDGGAPCKRCTRLVEW